MEGAKPTVRIGTNNAHLSVVREVVESTAADKHQTRLGRAWHS